MRVIAGSARSLPLKTVDGLDTRPTTDRIKETLFNMIQADIPGCRFLDLYSGSGAIGIEALSRGAAEAVLVENAKTACACIRDDLEFTKLDDKAVLMEQDVITAIAGLKGRGVFDIVFVDAPYGHGYDQSVLQALAGSDIIDEYTIIIIEEKLDADFSYAEQMGYTITKLKNYKTNKHIFLKRRGSE